MTSSADEKRLPITLLSGFLGSGKTTLLEHILRSKDHGLKCAVIVNDMGALNIDADLINSKHVVQKEEKVVQMENGCICCTLREDLLEEVVMLAENGSFDYLVIESTGISEPMQVAETFTSEFLEEMAEGNADSNKENSAVIAKLLKSGGISKIARLDTCVTVIDCKNFFSSFETIDSLFDRYGDNIEEADERTIVDLMIDQIEFADVILLNKTDLVTKEEKARVEAIIKKLNPVAKLISTQYSRVDLKEILNTKLFDFEKAATSAGWLQSLNEMTLQANGKLGPKPETLEYGIGSFVYKARRPFHPERLVDAVKKKFLIQCTTGQDVEGDDDEWETDSEHEHEHEEESIEEGEEEEIECESEGECDADPVITKKECPVFGPVLRSKGYIWLASCANYCCEWSQAGCVLRLGVGPKWFCEADAEEWPTDQNAIDSIKKDFENGETWKFGDRRQELVVIGVDLDENGITDLFDSCLLTDSEWEQYQDIMNNSNDDYLNMLEDAFPDPLGLSIGIEDSDEDDVGDDIEDGEEEDPIH